VAGVDAHSREGVVQDSAADGVEDDVEALAAGMRGHVLLHLRGGVVDRGGTELAHDRGVGGRGGGEDLGAAGAGDLHRDVADAASAAVHEDLVARADLGPVHQSLPGGDHRQRQGRGLAHGQGGGLVGQQAGVGGGVLGQ
jgi:hypothetical protein